jgi:hypothetical protein
MNRNRIQRDKTAPEELAMNHGVGSVGQASRLPSERASGSDSIPSASLTGAGETPALRYSQREELARRWRTLALAALLALTTFTPAFAQETNVAPATGFSAFRVISQRNIFNQSRRGVVQSRTRVRQTVVEAFSLVGTMSYAKGSFAFFESNNSEFQKVIEPGETIAGHKLIAIYPNGATLEAGGKLVVLQVGAQMRREDRGAWYSAWGATLPSTATGGGEESGGNVSSTPSEAPPSAANGEANEVLRKLMQLREQELK